MVTLTGKYYHSVIVTGNNYLCADSGGSGNSYRSEGGEAVESKEQKEVEGWHGLRHGAGAPPSDSIIPTQTEQEIKRDSSEGKISHNISKKYTEKRDISVKDHLSHVPDEYRIAAEKKGAVIFAPQAGGQLEFMQNTCYEVLFGGAAGPGKSWALVVDALGMQFKQSEVVGKAAIECGDYRAVLFRRQSTQFSKLLDEGRKIYTPLGAKLIYGRRGDPGPSFNFNSGARIFICHMDQEDDKHSHDGIEYQYIGFDELTQFTLTQYIHLLSRGRTTIPGLYVRIRSTTNPQGPGLQWVKRRFIKNGSRVLIPGKKYYFVSDHTVKSLEDNPMGINVPIGSQEYYDYVLKMRITQGDFYFPGVSTLAKSRTFIPGKLDDNLVLNERDPGYKYALKAMGGKYERALRYGDWDAFGGDFFDDFSKEFAVKPFDIPVEWTLYGSLDPGWSSPCSFGLSAVNSTGKIYRLFTYYVRDKSPQEHARAIIGRIKNFPWTQGRMPSITFSGRDAFAKKEKYGIVAHDRTFSDVFQEAGLFLSPAKTDRILGWQALKMFLRHKRWHYFHGFNEPLIQEITSAEHDEKDPEDISGKGNDPAVPDHAIDELRYLILSAAVPRDLKTEGLPEWFREEFESEIAETAHSVMGV